MGEVMIAATRDSSREPPAREAGAGGGVAAATPCKYFAKGWCKDGDRCRYSHAAATPEAAAPMASDAITIVFHLPGGAERSPSFKADETVFEIYTKTHELITDKDRAFSMTLREPRKNLDM